MCKWFLNFQPTLLKSETNIKCLCLLLWKQFYEFLRLFRKAHQISVLAFLLYFKSIFSSVHSRSSFGIIFRAEIAETTFHYCWEVKSSFKPGWMESSFPCNSLIGHSLNWRCCSLVLPISGLTKSSFDPLARHQSSFKLPALAHRRLIEQLYSHRRLSESQKQLFEEHGRIFTISKWFHRSKQRDSQKIVKNHQRSYKFVSWHFLFLTHVWGSLLFRRRILSLESMSFTAGNIQCQKCENIMQTLGEEWKYRTHRMFICKIVFIFCT